MRRQSLDNETLAIRVPVHMAERAIRALRKLELLDDRFEFGRSDRTLIVPIIREPSESERSQIVGNRGSAEVQRAILAEVRRRPRNLKEALDKELPKSMISKLPRSFDIIGDIAILELPHELDRFAQLIGKGVLSLNPHLRLVLRKASDISGIYRTRGFDAIAGTGSTETIHREFSNLLRLDIASVYFSPRLSNERMRVANQVKERERVIDMFAGVGPYSILIARTQPISMVYSIDINPEAFRYLKDNVLLNHVADRVVPILGDTRTVVRRSLQNVASRVIMNLPSESINFMDVALGALQDRGGIIHYYAFVSRNETIESTAASIRKIVERHGKKVRSLEFASILKEVASNRIQIALDLFVQ
jgi:tRNA (guanine37-N1)-methyltransferase